MSDPRTDLDRRLGAYAAEVVRWNRQINLVSRQDSARRVDELVSQCRIAGAVLGDEILGDWLGLDGDGIAARRASGAVAG